MTDIDNSVIAHMQHLIGYGKVCENKVDNKPVLEYHTVGADGNHYGIIREGSHYFVKMAYKRDREIITEDYNYLGGRYNRKDYRYNSYDKAAQNLEYMMRNIQENCNDRAMTVEKTAINEQADWQTKETVEMREAISRMNEISLNAKKIMKEDVSGFTMNHTLPEAPAKNPSDKEVNKPYDEAAKAEGDKDMNKTATDPAKQGEPFVKDGEVDSNDMQSDKKETGGEGDNLEKPKFTPENAVVAAAPKGGRTVKMNESQIAQCKAKLNESVVDAEDAAGLPEENTVETPELNDDNMEFEEEYNQWLNDGGEVGLETQQEEIPGVDDFDIDLGEETPEGTEEEEIEAFHEGRRIRGRKINEAELHVFGDHPRYQKEPMTLPPNTEPAKGMNTWDDDSAKGGVYGKKIGSSAPFDDKIIDMLTDAVMATLKKKA